MTEKEIARMLRQELGLCGHIIVERDKTRNKACLLPPGHDGGQHEPVVAHVVAPHVPRPPFQGVLQPAFQEVSATEMARVPLTRLIVAACEYGDSFAETDHKKDSARREAAHKDLCRVAREYAASTFERRKKR